MQNAEKSSQENLFFPFICLALPLLNGQPAGLYITDLGGIIPAAPLLCFHQHSEKLIPTFIWCQVRGWQIPQQQSRLHTILGLSQPMYAGGAL